MFYVFVFGYSFRVLFCLYVRFCFLFRGERSVFSYFGFLFNTFILLKNFTILSMFVFVDFENTSSSVIVCEPYMLILSMLNAGQLQSRWCAVSKVQRVLLLYSVFFQVRSSCILLCS